MSKSKTGTKLEMSSCLAFTHILSSQDDSVRSVGEA